MYEGLQWTRDWLEPLAGAASSGLAILLITALIRCLLIPAGVSALKAERARDRLAPRLAALRKRFASNPGRLHQETVRLYQDESVSPLAGMLPALLQAPILTVVYGVFIQQQIGGATNRLLAADFLGVQLGSSPAALVASGAIRVESTLAILAMLILLAIAGAVTRGRIRRRAGMPDGGPAGATVPTGSTGGYGSTAGITGVMQWIPFVIVPVAVVVPFTAGLYLLVSQLWAAAERPALARLVRARGG